MVDRAPSLSRRGLMAGAAATALLGSSAAAQPADPLCAIVAAYRAECERLNATVGDIPDDAPMPVWHALNEGRIPPATSRAGQCPPSGSRWRCPITSAAWTPFRPS